MKVKISYRLNPLLTKRLALDIVMHFGEEEKEKITLSN